MRPEELSVMSNEECVLTIRGLPPFKSKKFDIKEHMNYADLAEVNKKAFNMDAIPNLRFKSFFGIEEKEAEKVAEKGKQRKKQKIGGLVNA